MHFNVFVRACVCLYACTYISMYVRLAVFIFVGVIVWVCLRIYKQATVYIYVCLSHHKTKKKTYIRKKRRCVTKTQKEASSKRKIIKAEHKKVMILYDKNKQKNKNYLHWILYRAFLGHHSIFLEKHLRENGLDQWKWLRSWVRCRTEGRPNLLQKWFYLKQKSEIRYKRKDKKEGRHLGMRCRKMKK